jgi:hypothetical protein
MVHYFVVYIDYLFKESELFQITVIQLFVLLLDMRNCSLVIEVLLKILKTTIEIV